MPITHCPGCNKQLEVPDVVPGGLVSCPYCAHEFPVKSKVVNAPRGPARGGGRGRGRRPAPRRGGGGGHEDDYGEDRGGYYPLAVVVGGVDDGATGRRNSTDEMGGRPGRYFDPHPAAFPAKAERGVGDPPGGGRSLDGGRYFASLNNRHPKGLFLVRQGQ